MNKEELKSLLESNKSNIEISNILDISISMVCRYRQQLKIPFKKKEYDWNAIQIDHNNGISYRGLNKKYGIAIRTIQRAIKEGKFIPVKRSKPSKKEQAIRKRIIDRECWMRYYARKKYQTPADADIKALQEFYKNCPEGYEVDHIIPISKGGQHTLRNLQYLTKIENRRKSNKIL